MHIKIERLGQRGVAKIVGIDICTDRDGTEYELERRPQESRCNGSEPPMPKNNKKLKVPLKKSKQGFMDRLS